MPYIPIFLQADITRDFMLLANRVKDQIKAALPDITVVCDRRVQTIDEGDFVNVRPPEFEQIGERLGGGVNDIEWTVPMDLYAWDETREGVTDTLSALVNSVISSLYDDRTLSGDVTTLAIVAGSAVDEDAIPAFYRGAFLDVILTTYEKAV